MFVVCSRVVTYRYRNGTFQPDDEAQSLTATDCITQCSSLHRRKSSQTANCFRLDLRGDQ